MRNTTDVTPAEAKAVWERLGKPSSRKVSQLLAAHGRVVSSQTVARWRSAGWPPVASRTREGLDNSIAAVIGKPNATVGDLPPVAPFAPDLPIVQALEETCRDGLNAARTVFRLIATDPALIRSMPVNIGVMLQKTGMLVAKLAEALGGRDGIIERGMKDVSGAVRTRENEPLAPVLELWEKHRHPPARDSDS